MKLYEIDNNLRAVWDRIAEQEGELTEQDISELESLEIAKDEKIKGYGVIIREIMSDITKVSQEIERLETLKKRLQTKANWLTSNLSRFMHDNQMKEYKSLEVNITFRASKQLQIFDEGKLAKKWFRTEKVIKVDKQAIKDFINAGGKVKGCEIIEKQNIQIK